MTPREKIEWIITLATDALTRGTPDMEEALRDISAASAPRAVPPLERLCAGSYQTADGMYEVFLADRRVWKTGRWIIRCADGSGCSDPLPTLDDVRRNLKAMYA